MSFLQRLEMMQWSVSGYQGGDDSGGGGGGSDNPQTGLPTYSPPSVDEIVDRILNNQPSEPEDRGAGQQYNPNVNRPTFDAPKALDEAMFVGNAVDKDGNRIRSPQSERIFLEDQARRDREAAKEAERLRIQREKEALLKKQQAEVAKQQGLFDDMYKDIAFGEGVNTSYAFNPNVGKATLDTPNLLDYLGSVQDDYVTAQDLQDYQSFLSNDAPRENLAVIDNKLLEQRNDTAAGFAGKFGQGLGNFIFGSLGGGFTGDVLYGQTDNVGLALQGDAAVRMASETFKPLEINTYRDAQGNEYVHSSQFGSKTLYTMEEVEANAARALEEANRWAENSSDDDIADSLRDGLGAASAAAGASKGWRQYRDNSFDIADIAKGALLGSVDGSKYKSAEFGTRVALGENIVSAATDVYGTNALRGFLPDGYEDITETGLRIGLGENRVDVIGDVYDVELNLRNPLGQAGLEALSVYDKTGDLQQALFKGAKKYKDEDGKLPSLDDLLPALGDKKFGTPDNIKAIEDAIKAGGSFVEDTVKDFLNDLGDKMPATPEGLKSLEDFARSVGSTTEDLIRQAGSTAEEVIKDLLGSVPDMDTPAALKMFEDFAKQAGSSLEDIIRAGGERVEAFVKDLIPKVEADFDVSTGKFNFPDMPDIDLGWLEDILKGIKISTGFGEAGKIQEEEEFASLEEDEDLFDPTRSLARELLGMEQTKSVQEAQENS